MIRMGYVGGSLLVLALATGCATIIPQQLALRHREFPTDTGDVALVETRPVNGGTAYIYTLRSQEWQGIEWTHWLTVIRPDELRHPDTALLYIGAGSNEATGPSGRMLGLAPHAQATGSVIAGIEQVPNQPLFDGLYEDHLIAYTFDRFLEGDGDDWPLLRPMVMSVSRAMDAIQGVSAQEHGQRIEGFVLTGASKRGWTAWLTATQDPRVVAAAPMVFDMLNLGPQLELQQRSYGAYSDMIAPYTERGLQEQLETSEGQELAAAIDPFSYRDRLTMPKLVLLGTNDPYWTVDAANLYFGDLPGESHLYYAPNHGHQVGKGGIQTLMAFYQSQLTGAAMPVLDWEWDEAGNLLVSWDRLDGEARLWQAVASTRDFRDAEWTSRPIEAEGRCLIPAEPPDVGYGAFFVEVTFGETDALPPFSLSTGMTVLPE